MDRYIVRFFNAQICLLVSVIYICQALCSVDETMAFKLSTHLKLNLT